MNSLAKGIYVFGSVLAVVLLVIMLVKSRTDVEYAVYLVGMFIILVMTAVGGSVIDLLAENKEANQSKKSDTSAS